MFHRASALILFAGFLTACAPAYWSHPTKTAEDFERDRANCAEIAEKRTRASWGDEDYVLLVSEETDRCLKLKFGWKLE